MDELDTPALCIDLSAMERNIRRMAELCRRHGVAWRPHSKAHKSPQIARMEIEAGALGVTCAKLGEAEVMAAGGVRDILVANQVVGPQKMRRLVDVCRQADLILAVDHVDQVRAISRATSAEGVSVRLIVEVDIGLQRAGAAPGEPTVELAKFIAAQKGVQLAGIMGYEGHLLTIADAEEKSRRIRDALAILKETRDALSAVGLPCPIVSCGGTGSYDVAMHCPGITELQAGGLIFMDAFYRHKCHVADFEYALFLLVTVVSRPAPDRAIIDAGRKSHHGDHHPSLVLGHEHDIRVTRLSAEHGELALGESARSLKIGDRLLLVPGYSDMTNVLHDQFYGIRNGRLEVVLPLVGRGRLQ
ncbi:MAG: DSD1 family PLP-dependent enzyme [Planctomycetia bacterium]|nr:DSD1 family PLP-dependent enzyme [Planctomycetia bacterium]